MTIDEGEPAADAAEPVTDHATIEQWQRRLGELLAVYRRAAGLSQPELGHALGRTRSALSKIEHGHRTMPARLWALADERCGADGALVAEHKALADAQRSYRDWCQAHHRQAQQQAAQAELEALRAAPVPGTAAAALLDVTRHDAWLTGIVGSELAGEFLAVVTRLIRALGRRDAMRVAAWTLTALGLSAGLDPDEYERVAHAVAKPSRVDAQVIHNLASTLATANARKTSSGPAGCSTPSSPSINSCAACSLAAPSDFAPRC